MERNLMLDHQRIIRRTSEMLGRSQPNHLGTVSPALGEYNHSLVPQRGFPVMNHNFHPRPNYPHGSVPGRAEYLCLQDHQPSLNVEVLNASNFNDPSSIPPLNCMPNYAPQSHSSSAAVNNPGSPIQGSYVYFTYRQHTSYLVEQHSVINVAEDNIWTWDCSELTEIASFSHGNYIHRLSPDIREMGRQNQSLGAHVHPYIPPMQAISRNNSYNIHPQVPSSSHGDRINYHQQHYTANSSWNRTGSWNRNFIPAIPVDQMPDQNTLLPEDNILDRLGYMTIDDVLLLQGGTNSNVSSSRIDDEDTIMVNEELFELNGLIGPIGTGLPREQILVHLKIRTHITSADQLNSDEEPEICVICQAEYEANEKIGTLDCGHFYHAECIRKWLQQKNVCPICKATGLAIRGWKLTLEK